MDTFSFVVLMIFVIGGLALSRLFTFGKSIAENDKSRGIVVDILKSLWK